MKTTILSIFVLTITYISDAQMQAGSFEFEGRIRDYEVYLPQNFEANMPLIISLHGYTETIAWYKAYTLLHETGDTARFITVYPAPIDKSWNSGLIAPGWPVIDTNVNDVGFISALIDTLKTHYDINMSRIYCCGFSLGGEMTYKLTGELGHRFAAVASVAGLINEKSAITCNPVRPFPIIHFHGTLDNYETWSGDDKNLWTVPETINFWLEKNCCSLPGDTVLLPDLYTDDGCTVEKISYLNCSGEGTFIFYKIIEGGHAWPSSAFTWNGEGNKNMDINANEEIWNFFKNYENPYVDIAYSKSLEANPFCIQSASDTLTVRAMLSNSENHPVALYAIIQGNQSSYLDSIKLFNDGLHSDSDSSDNIWGNIKLLPELPEDAYKVDLVTHDNTFGTEQKFHWPARFINFGPVTIGDYTFDESDTEPNPGDRIKLKLTLENHSFVAKATSIKAGLISLNTLVSVPNYSITFNDIAAGENSLPSTYTINISEECPINTELPIQVNIYSYDHLCWIDTFSIIVQEPVNIKDIREPITNIYPNPTNNIINIEIENPNNATIEIYNINGRLVLCKTVNSKVEKIDVSGLSKGMYFIKVRQVDSVYVGKVVIR